jgi:hypothetical protein
VKTRKEVSEGTMGAGVPLSLLLVCSAKIFFSDLLGSGHPGASHRIILPASHTQSQCVDVCVEMWHSMAS